MMTCTNMHLDLIHKTYIDTREIRKRKYNINKLSYNLVSRLNKLIKEIFVLFKKKETVKNAYNNS